MIEVVALLVALQAADFASTYVGMTRYGLVERNGPLSWLMERIGIVQALSIYKGVGAAVSVYVGLHGPVVGLVLAAVYTAVVFNNLRLIREKKESAK